MHNRLAFLRKLIVPALFLLAAAMPTSIAAMNAALGLLLLVWFLAGSTAERQGAFHAAIPLLPFLAAVTITIAVSPTPQLSGFRQFFGWIAMPLAVVFFPHIDIRRWLRVFGAALAIAGVLGALQFLGGTEIWDIGLRPVRGVYRASGFFVNAMTFGGVFMFAVLVFASLAIEGLKNRVLFFAALLFTLIALMLSVTRSAVAGLAAALPILLTEQRRALIGALVIGCIGTLVVVNLPPVMSRIPSVSQIIEQPREVLGLRALLWEDAFAQFQQRPVFGWGPRTYRMTLHDRHPGEIPKFITHAHNNFFQLMAESGLVGLAGFITTLGWIFVRIWRGRRGPFRRAGLACMVAVIAAGLFEYNLGDSEVVVNLMVWIGLALTLGKPNSAQTGNSLPAPQPVQVA